MENTHSNIRIERMDSSDLSQWDAFIRQSPHGTVFHESGILQRCCRYLERGLRVYGCFEGEKQVGGCALYTESLLNVITLASSTCETMPYGGVLLCQEKDDSSWHREHRVKGVVHALDAAFAEEKFQSISIVHSPYFKDIRPFVWKGWDSDVLYTHCIDLRSPYADRYNRNVRRHIKKAEKVGLRCSESSDISTFIRLWAGLYTKQGENPPIPEPLVKEIYTWLRGQGKGKLYTVETADGETIAGQVVCWDARSVYFWAVGWDTAYTSLNPVTFLFNGCLADLQSTGHSRANLMQANEPRFSNFINNFGPTLVPYYFVGKKKRILMVRDSLLRDAL